MKQHFDWGGGGFWLRPWLSLTLNINFHSLWFYLEDKRW